MHNTIILLKGVARLTNEELKKFNKGDLIMGNDSTPEKLKRWSIAEDAAAKEELANYKCSYEQYNEYLTDIEEYALEYCECDEDGEFLSGSDFEFAEE